MRKEIDDNLLKNVTSIDLSDDAYQVIHKNLEHNHLGKLSRQR